MLGDRLELEGLLLSVVSRQDLVEYDDCAVAVSCRKHEALTIGRPEKDYENAITARKEREGIPCHIRKFTVMKVRQDTNRARLLRVVDRHSIGRCHGVKHPVRQRKHGARTRRGSRWFRNRRTERPDRHGITRRRCWRRKSVQKS